MKLILCLLILPFDAFGWGSIGHRVVGELAQHRLSPVARARVKGILGKDSLADVANWADFIRSEAAWEHAAPWHYTSVADGKTYNPAEANKAGDVVEAIGRYAKELADPKLSALKKREALSFLVHFVGDVHQPLHVGRPADKGGNTIMCKWFGQDTNLHEIWDEKLVEMEKLSYTEYARSIDKASSKEEAEWRGTPLFGWVEESMALRPLVYRFYPKEKAWEYRYSHDMRSHVHRRLLQAGVRLATLLNGVFRAKTK